MSGFLPGLAQLAAAGLVKAGLAKRPENSFPNRGSPSDREIPPVSRHPPRKLKRPVMSPKSNHARGVKLI